MLRQNLIHRFAQPENFPGMDIDIGRLARKAAHGWLMDQNSGVRQGKTFPRSPGSQSSSAPMLAAWPTQMVVTSGRMNCIVS